MRKLIGAVVVALVGVLAVAVPASAEAVCIIEDVDEPHHDAVVDLKRSCVSYIGDRIEVSFAFRDSSDPRTDHTWWRPESRYTAYAQAGVYVATSGRTLLWDVADGTPSVAVWDEATGSTVGGCQTSWRHAHGTVVVTVQPSWCLAGERDARISVRPLVVYGETHGDLMGDDDYQGPSAYLDANQTYGIGRLHGTDRYETAARVAARAFPAASPVVYLARGDEFADAVAGGSLTDGPVLLVPSCAPVPQVVRDAVARHRPDRVVALGGRGAICDQVLRDAAQGRPTSRIFGQSRADTAVEISRRSFPDGAPSVYLARQDNLVDALAGGVLPDGPVLLVPSCGKLPSSVVERLGQLQPSRVFALGGSAAVCQSILDRAVSVSGDEAVGRRISGSDRYATARRVAERVLALQPDLSTLYAVNGSAPADAVAAGALTDGPIVFTQPCGWAGSPAAAVARSRSWSKVIAVGGPAVLCDHTFHVLAQPPGQIEP